MSGKKLLYIFLVLVLSACGSSCTSGTKRDPTSTPPPGMTDSAAGAAESGKAVPLRIAEPLDAVIADLQAFIPLYMEQQGVPGVSIAILREGQVAWTGEFGVTNLRTRQPVIPVSTFGIASNSKVVTAYIALRLVDRGLLSLDEPLDNYLAKPFLPQEAFRSVVTLRHVLSHTSGMGHSGLARNVRFPPGAGYSYSASGFLYTQAVLESATGKSLEELGQELVFQPLGMPHSSFVYSPAVMEGPAYGHMPVVIPAIIFVVPFLTGLLLLRLVALVVGRIRTGRWRVSRRAAFLVYLLAALPACILAFVLARGLNMRYALLIAIIWGIPFLAWLLADLTLKRLFSARARLRKGLLVTWVILVVFAMSAVVVAGGDVPNSVVASVKPNAAGSVRSTAADMARFLIEIADPHYLSSEMAAQMRTPQVSLHPDLAWGLGPGIQHSPDGDALWQWGQALDYQSVMIIYPDLGYGVVVLANSDLLNPDVAIEIAHRALGGSIEPIRAGSHLAFNYQGSFPDQ